MHLFIPSHVHTSFYPINSMRTGTYPACSLLNPQHLAEFLVHSRCSVAIWWINEWNLPLKRAHACFIKFKGISPPHPREALHKFRTPPTAQCWPSKCSFSSMMLCDVNLHSLSALWDFTPISHPSRESPLFSMEALSFGFCVLQRGLMFSKATKPAREVFP